MPVGMQACPKDIRSHPKLTNNKGTKVSEILGTSRPQTNTFILSLFQHRSSLLNNPTLHPTSSPSFLSPPYIHPWLPPKEESKKTPSHTLLRSGKLF